MDFDISFSSYGIFGGNPTLAIVGGFLEMGAPDFGSAFTEIRITACFRRSDRKKHKDDDIQKYHEYLEELPKIRCMRKQQRIEFEYYCQIGTVKKVSGHGPARLDLFLEFYQDLRQQLEFLKKKIPKKDDFAVDRFLQWVNAKETDLPQDDEMFERLEEEILQYHKAKFAAMDEWEKLAIDWCDFHPDARSVLDDTFFWDVCNNFAPNGNDTGADLLSFFQDWRKKHRKASSRIFFTDLMKGWGVNQNPGPDDNFSIETYDESTVALAFAHLKIEAACPVWIRDDAIRSIERQESIIRENHASWDHFNERMETFAKVRKKLESCPTIDG